MYSVYYRGHYGWRHVVWRGPFLNDPGSIGSHGCNYSFWMVPGTFDV